MEKVMEEKRWKIIPITDKKKLKLNLSNKERNIFVSILIFFSVITTIIPYGIVIPLALVACRVFIILPIGKIINYLFIGIIASSFLGSYLGIPGNQSIFMFRILLILHVVLFILFKNKEWERLSNYKFINLLLSIWIFGNFLSLFWTNATGETLRYIYYSFEASYLIWLIMYHINNSNNYRMFSNIIIWFYFIALIMGCAEVITGWHLPSSGSNFYDTSTSKFQPTAFLFNTNDYAMYLCIFFPMVFHDLWNSKRLLANVYLAILVLILSFYLVIMTYSRLGIISISLEVMIVFWVYMRRSIIFIPFFISVYLLISSFGDKGYLLKVLKVIQEAFTKKGASTNERIQIYSTSWDIVQDSHFIGVGAGNVPIQIKNYWLGHQSVNHLYKAVHNFWLESMGGIGFFALSIVVLYIFILLMAIRYWWRNISHITTIKYFLPMLIIVVFYFSSIGLSTIIEKRYLWLALGIAIKLLNMESLKKGDD
ncbi:hypothetical protein IAW_06055 [Bacillus cereus str. Schrouff]|uniref:O-antigen ligase family protein n=1 Tax=Bacillus cereus TaxID=1396 RepID=UPI0003309C08|nr:O-antigen ligase family protein [Bacillus cereus]EOO04741.1 hypothetical protein IAW_06055 [Bacillus cereus str. Schrouff]EOO81409.1 hypothetical protein IGY_05839 [Bacillus cereus K-5975c]